MHRHAHHQQGEAKDHKPRILFQVSNTSSLLLLSLLILLLLILFLFILLIPLLSLLLIFYMVGSLKLTVLLHRYSGRTQKQMQEHVRENFVKRQSFQR